MSAETNKEKIDQEKLAADAQSAVSTIMERVYSQSFFNKLAELGHVPSTHQEAVALLDLGSKITSAEATGVVKTASVGPYAQVNDAVGQYLATNDKSMQSGSHQMKVQRAQKTAFALAHDPEIYAAAALVNAVKEQAY